MRFFKEAIISCVRVNVIETQLVSNLKAQETRNSQQVLVFVSQNRLWVQVHGFSAVMSKREITAKSDVIVKTLTLVQIHREHQQTHNSDIYTACSQRWRTSHGQKTGFCLAFFFLFFFWSLDQSIVESMTILSEMMMLEGLLSIVHCSAGM